MTEKSTRQRSTRSTRPDPVEQTPDRDTPGERTPGPERPAEKPSRPAEKPAERRCNLPGCEETPEWRGLCPAHRQTHRGLADPKERSGD